MIGRMLSGWLRCHMSTLTPCVQLSASVISVARGWAQFSAKAPTLAATSVITLFSPVLTPFDSFLQIHHHLKCHPLDQTMPTRLFTLPLQLQVGGHDVQALT